MVSESSLRTVSRAARGGSRHRLVAGWAVAGLVGVVVLSVGVLVGALLVPSPTPVMVAESSPGGSVAVSQESFDGSHDVLASLMLGPSLVLRTPVGGVVVDSACVASEVIQSGTSPLRVDGQPILALATLRPLWRDLTFGVDGDDVSWLQSELTRLGYPVDVSGVFDVATVAAVTGLANAVGVPLPRWGVLPLSVVMWLPASQITVAACSVQVGASVNAGDEFAQVAGVVEGLRLAVPPGEDGWVVSFAGATAVVDQAGLVSDPVFLATVESAPEFQAATGPGGNGSVILRTGLATPIQVVVVPPSAVVVSGQGTGCLFSSGHPVPVNIISSALGQTMVQVTSGSLPDRVDVRPGSSASCS